MVSGMRGKQLRGLAGAAAIATLVAGCSLTGGGNLLGGREKCWPQDPPRGASIWRGILTMDENGFRIITPDGEPIWLLPGSLRFNWTPGAVGELVDGAGKVVARAGEDITLFGGMGSDGGLVVCGLEENTDGEG